MADKSPGIRLTKIQQNRLWNFRQIIRQLGGVNETARRVERKNSQITAVAGPTPSRAIGNSLASAIETALQLESGSLDKEPPKEATGPDVFLAEMSRIMAPTGENEKELVIEISKTIASFSAKKLSVDTIDK